MYQIFKITSNPTVDFAAEELKKYMRMMMPECGEIFIKYDPTATEGLRLGLLPDLGLDTSEAEDVELDDIVHVDVDGDGNGVLAGSNPRSVLFAVYRYLQENGCRWLFPGIDGEYIPMQDVHAVQYHKMADMRYRGQCNEGAEIQGNMMEAIDFTPKIGMNVFMLEFACPYVYYNRYYSAMNNDTHEAEPVSAEQMVQWKRQCEAEISKRGLQFHDMGHGWTAEPFGMDTAYRWKHGEDKGGEAPVPPESRDFLAMINGERKVHYRGPMNTQFCMSNARARKLVVDYIVNYSHLHQNVDYLHVWLADSSNNHCECEECQKMIPSDWYVMLMNELDEALTKKGLATRIVFISYMDTAWPPLVEKIKNPKRFSLLSAPISRRYTESVPADVSDATYTPYVRNNLTMFPTVAPYIKCAKDWQSICRVPAMLYEYHFWLAQYLDLGVLNFARVVYDDIQNYHKHGFNGLINDCSQRSYWPNGFAFYVYGQAQFDTSVPFETLLEDYFSHAYGADWREVVELFQKIGKAIDTKYLNGQRSANEKIGKHYNPAMAESLRKMPEIAQEYKEFLEAHRVMPYRAQTVAFKLLRYYMEYCEGVAAALIPKCYGAGAEAKELFEKFYNSFGRHEPEIATCYDQFLAPWAFSSRIFNRPETLSFDV